MRNSLRQRCVLLSTAVVLISGCGAQLRPNVQAVLRTDGDRYAEAIAEAVDAYEREVRAAEAIATGPAIRGLDAQIAISLSTRGLSERGLDVYCEFHPEFLGAQRALHRPRLDAIDRRAGELAGQLAAPGSSAAAIPGEPIALR